MKRFFSIMLLCMTLTIASLPAMSQNKQEIRLEYVLKNLNLDKTVAAKFKPVLKAYLKETKDAKDIYDDVKDKYKTQEKEGKLTDTQASQLLKAKLDSESKLLAIRKKYQPKFIAIISAKKAYYAFDLANDKMSKITGEK